MKRKKQVIIVFLILVLLILSSVSIYAKVKIYDINKLEAAASKAGKWGIDDQALMWDHINTTSNLLKEQQGKIQEIL